MIYVILVVVIVVLVIAYSSRRRAAGSVRNKAQFASYAKETLDRPADIAVGLLTEHMPTLVAKATPHIKRDGYGVLTLAPEFDGEIRYFIERVMLTDPSYLRAANEAMKIDPDARSRLFASTVMEPFVRNTLLGAYEDQAGHQNLPA